MDQFLVGTIAMAFAVVGLFFLRFWRDTGDRLFLIFALAFWLLFLTRLGLIGAGELAEYETLFYVGRLIAYLLILFAILDKNRFWRRWTEERKSEEAPTEPGEAGETAFREGGRGPFP